MHPTTSTDLSVLVSDTSGMVQRYEDLTGRVFGKLRVIRLLESNGRGAYWECQCACSSIVTRRASVLRSGVTSSCGCGRSKDLTGRTFGKLTCQRRTGKRGNKIFWSCVCLCGNTIDVWTSSLTRGHTTSCGECRGYELTGQKFGRLTVQSRAGTLKNQVIWNCACECGGHKQVKSNHLVKSLVRSCGCLRRNHLTSIVRPKYDHETMNRGYLLTRYKQTAVRRGLTFTLSDEEAHRLFKGSCGYCGSEPRQKADVYPDAPYEYNGIDRVNNERDYETGNVVSCCKTCNTAKASMTYQEFLQWAKRVVLTAEQQEVAA
jgi:hypothetical protein